MSATVLKNFHSYTTTDNTAGTLGLKAGDDCPRCSGELMAVTHRYQDSGGHPDCDWLACLDCNFQTDPE